VTSVPQKVLSRLSDQLSGRAGLPEKAWPEIFDVEAYVTRNFPDDVHMTDRKARDHFRSVGFQRMFHISFVHTFDPAFYTRHYPDLPRDSASAYRHWLVHGLAENRVESVQALLRPYNLPSDGVPPGFNVRRYAAAAGLAAEIEPAIAFIHFLDNADADVDTALSGIVSLELAATVANYHARSGDYAAARLYHQLAASDPDQQRESCHALGDLCIANNDFYLAVLCYEQASRAAAFPMLWTELNRSVALSRLGRHLKAFEAASFALKNYPASELARELKRTTADPAFAEVLRESQAILRLRPRQEAVQRLEAGIHMLQSSNPHGQAANCRRSHPRPSSVAIVSQPHLRQCYLYRVEARAEQLKKLGYDVSLFDLDSDMTGLESAIGFYGTLIVSRLQYSPRIAALIGRARDLGVRTIYELDDLLLDAASYPPPLEELGSLVSEEEHKGMMLIPSLHRTLASICDYGFASTAPIQRALESLVISGVCFLVENGLSSAHAEAIARATASATKRDDETIVIHYGSGGRSHSENFRVAEAALIDLLRRHPSVKLQVIGPLDITPELQSLGSQVEHLNFLMDRSGYWRTLAQSDISLAPLLSSPFNDAKSDIKWLEAAMFGIPSVVSATPTYLSCVGHDNAMLCCTAPDWHTALERLVRDPEYRKEIGDRARDAALAKRSLDLTSRALAETFDRMAELDGDMGTGESGEGDRLRVLVVNVYFSPQNYGGATHVAAEAAFHMADRYGDAVEIEAFCAIEGAQTSGSSREYVWNGMRVTSVLAGLDPGVAPETNVFVAGRLREVIERFKPHVAHVHCIQVLTASVVDELIMADVPFIVHVHDGWWISDHQFLLDERGQLVTETGDWGDPARLLRLRHVIGSATKIITPSKYFQNLLTSRGISGVEVLPNFVQPIERRHPENGPVLQLALLGGLGAAKGADLLRKTLRLEHFPNLKFLVVDHKTAGHRRLEMWGNNQVELPGMVSRDRVQQLYDEIDVLLGISVCVESFGLVAKEAMSAGKWVVASDRGAIGEGIVHGRNGFIIDVDSPSGLLRILRLLNTQSAFYKKTIPEPTPSLLNLDDYCARLLQFYQTIANKSDRDVNLPLHTTANK
jgi:glycosyltransferase involved in cell wall biosynthesis/tetratricopeptide (TPR) repeat protein